MVAGCVSTSVDLLPASAPDYLQPRPTVIAVIDTGVNIYHEAFRLPVASLDPGAFLPNAVPLSVRQNGSFQERMTSDAALLESLRAGQLYRFPGTRIAAISFGAPDNVPLLLDYASHGTGTAYLALREDPGAFVVAVQVHPRICSGVEECLVDGSVAAAMEWVAEQPWIDVVSVSLNLRANPPDAARSAPEMMRYLEASKRVAVSGRLIVNSAGNELVPSVGSTFAGPPWVIAVGGFEAASRGEGLTSSRLVDVVSNNSEQIPVSYDIEMREWASGTSFATPIVAGTLSNSISQLRARLADTGRWNLSAPLISDTSETYPRAIGAAEIRHALNWSARQMGPTDWDPSATPRGDPVRDLLYSSLPIVVGPLQMGWGYVNGSLAAEMTALVLGDAIGRGSEPSTETRLHQGTLQRVREAYWHEGD